MTTDFKQRVLITAGGSGIGRAMAHAFDVEGADIWVTDIDELALASVPEHWICSQVDASNEVEMEALFEEIEDTWNGVDVVCANAGIAGPTAFIEDIDLAEWQRCVSVSLEGAFLATKFATPLLKTAKSGVFIYTASTAGIYGCPSRAPYTAAKWATIGLMKTVTMELGPYGVRANAICPGCVEGPRIQGVLEREAIGKGVSVEHIRDGYAAGTSMQTFVKAEDVANMAVFLASEKARFVSGQIIAVDGHTENPDPKV
ncbi:MAG: SDR family oxidoreductase [Alphaproteobacteria bacterium]